MLFRQGAAAQGLAPRRLDLDDVGAALRQQKGRVGSLKDLPEIDDREAREGQPPRFRPDARHRALAPPQGLCPAICSRCKAAPGRAARLSDPYASPSMELAPSCPGVLS